MQVDHRYKQVILLRSDLGMSKGKLIVQGAHAAVMSAILAQTGNTEAFKKWIEGGYKKIALRVASEDDLYKYQSLAYNCGLCCYLVKDAGLTQLEPDTATAVAIGPELATRIDAITGGLPLF